MSTSITLLDLQSQRRRLEPELSSAIERVLDHGRFLDGPEVDELEHRLCALGESGHVVSCSSGTDALVLALMALGVTPGDTVLVPAFTFAATAEAVVLVGAQPVFVDVLPQSFNVDPDAVDAALARLDELGEPPPVGLIAVDLYGHPARYEDLVAVGRRLNWVMADAAQSLGAERRGRPVGSLARVSCTSFYPAKPLGCYGDGGAVLTEDPELAALLRSLRAHGQGSERYEHLRVGMTARLDTIQAAVLLEKLRIFSEELERRMQLAARYNEALDGQVVTPVLDATASSSWAQYTIRVRHRDQVARRLADRGIPTSVHYPRALPDQPAFSHAVPPVPTVVARELAQDVLSLPLHPYLSEQQQDLVVGELLAAIR